MLYQRRAALVIGLACAAAPLAAAAGQEKGPRTSQAEYEGWRQYEVHCARCHGQSVLGNPVAANLLASTKPGGPVAEKGAFLQVVNQGRPSRGMPGFAKILTPEQAEAIYAYVRGRAEGRIPPGRPQGADG